MVFAVVIGLVGKNTVACLIGGTPCVGRAENGNFNTVVKSKLYAVSVESGFIVVVGIYKSYKSPRALCFYIEFRAVKGAYGGSRRFFRDSL